MGILVSLHKAARTVAAQYSHPQPSRLVRLQEPNHLDLRKTALALDKRVEVVAAYDFRHGWLFCHGTANSSPVPYVQISMPEEREEVKIEEPVRGHYRPAQVTIHNHALREVEETLPSEESQDAAGNITGDLASNIAELSLDFIIKPYGITRVVPCYDGAPEELEFKELHPIVDHPHYVRDPLTYRLRYFVTNDSARLNFENFGRLHRYRIHWPDSFPTSKALSRGFNKGLIFSPRRDDLAELDFDSLGDFRRALRDEVRSALPWVLVRAVPETPIYHRMEFLPWQLFEALWAEHGNTMIYDPNINWFGQSIGWREGSSQFADWIGKMEENFGLSFQSATPHLA
ncbi:MAG: hypothetical protein ABIE84_00410 [bacterium]